MLSLPQSLHGSQNHPHGWWDRSLGVLSHPTRCPAPTGTSAHSGARRSHPRAASAASDQLGHEWDVQPDLHFSCDCHRAHGKLN